MLTPDILLITPPFTQLNTPYPATVFLKGLLDKEGFSTYQADLGIETLNLIFSNQKLSELFDYVANTHSSLSDESIRMLSLRNDYVSNIEIVMSFLQGKSNSMATAFCNGVLPQGKRFNNLQALDNLFGQLGIIDKAKYLCTLFLEDIGDFITLNIDSQFGFSRYAEQVSIMATNFTKLIEIQQNNTPITKIMTDILQEKVNLLKPKSIGFSVPFPGNFISMLKCAAFIKQNFPQIPVILGGGYVNTELRLLNEPRLFDFVDFVCLDKGERPLVQLLKYLFNNGTKEELKRTYLLEYEEVKYYDNPSITDYKQDETGTPSYQELPLDKYISTLEIANPMHRLWNDGRWNKLIVAHGCYWHKCAFCDTTLDYINDYQKVNTIVLVDRMEAMIKQTGQRGFHFVDEAAPPVALRELAIEIIKRKLKVTWWANIRFEKNFSYDLCRLMAASGCIAISGGLEVASDRLLKLIDKGVTVNQVVEVTHNLAKAGILVHAYLMYGFPTQTAQETIDSLEVVRQLFFNGLLQSAYWHRFVMTSNSLTGKNPEKYGAIRKPHPVNAFATNDCEHSDSKGCNHDLFAYGLRKALYNYMHGICFDYYVNEWFDFKTPRSKVDKTFVKNIIEHCVSNNSISGNYFLWIGNQPIINHLNNNNLQFMFHNLKSTFKLEINKIEGTWLINFLKQIDIENNTKQKIAFWQENFSNETKKDFTIFSQSRQWKTLRKNGLLIL